MRRSRRKALGATILSELYLKGLSTNALRRGQNFGSLSTSSRAMQAFLLRVGDVLIALALIVFTLPLMVLVALAIKLDSDGPVFAWQARLGHNGRRFFAVKFRTTEHDPERAIWDRGTRETAVGRFLHQTRIDDLPTVLNVLAGDIPIIGCLGADRSVNLAHNLASSTLLNRQLRSRLFGCEAADRLMNRFKLTQDRVLATAMFTIPVVLAWAYLLLGPGTEIAMMGIGDSQTTAMASWSPAYAAAMFIMWVVMMVAMMLPSAAKVILIAAAFDRKQPVLVAARRIGEFVAGYLVVWVTFSFAAAASQWALDKAGLLSTTMATSNSLVAGSLLMYAGIYQWNPIKQACLTHCRAPEEFLASHLRRDGPFGTGLRHGMFCFGCCWMLMGLLFVGGVMNFACVAVITVAIVVEKILSRSRWITWGIGVALIAGGVITLVELDFNCHTTAFYCLSVL
jgi:predicted metal-binding membrane protein